MFCALSGTFVCSPCETMRSIGSGEEVMAGKELFITEGFFPLDVPMCFNFL